MKEAIRWLSVLAFLGLAACGPGAPKVSGRSFYVDCGQGHDTSTGLSAGQAWGSLEKVNQTVFQPGDGIFFKRGSTCAGTLYPLGSGTEGSPISIAAYGKGPRPNIDAGKKVAAFTLIDQQYWELQDLEFTGGVDFGILVTGTPHGGTLRHFRLTDLVVHDVYGDPPEDKVFGLVIFKPGAGGDNRFEDVILDGVTAYNTNQWAGISILGSNHWPIDMENPDFGENITVRNSTVYNTWGDGITLFYVRHGLIEYSVAHETGQQPPPQTIGTPSSIWTWACHDCTVQYNESYNANTPEIDGGAYDIDWGTRRNLYQYNYGHDNVGYCISVFGAGGLTTTDAVIRYNVCANNGRKKNLALRQGDVFLSTWDGGKIDGVQIYNNTFYWNPETSAPLIINRAQFTGEKEVFFKNNLVVTTVPWLIDTDKTLEMDYNLYWYTGDPSKKTTWLYGNMGIYNNLADLQAAGVETHGLYADPMVNELTYHAVGRPKGQFTLLPGSPAIDAGVTLPDMGGQDFFGNPLHSGAGIDIGAHERQQTSAGFDMQAFDSLTNLSSGPILLAFLDPRSPQSRSQWVFLRSLLAQRGVDGLRAVLVVPQDAPENTVYDWQASGVLVWRDDGRLAKLFRTDSAITSFYIGRDGGIQAGWKGLALPYQLSQLVNEGS